MPLNLHIGEASKFFLYHMRRPLQAKRGIYERRNIRFGSAVTPSDWEVFASLLVDELGNGGVSGVDLENFEVKSAMNNGSYEYQYHKETGKAKLKGDMKAGHLFINHSNCLNDVEVRYVPGEKLKSFFSKWLKNYPSPYPQRYRKNIPFGWVDKHGMLLIAFRNGSVQPSLDIL